MHITVLVHNIIAHKDRNWKRVVNTLKHVYATPSGTHTPYPAGIRGALMTTHMLQ